MFCFMRVLCIPCFTEALSFPLSTVCTFSSFQCDTFLLYLGGPLFPFHWVFSFARVNEVPNLHFSLRYAFLFSGRSELLFSVKYRFLAS